jgi:hypothetical protein
MVLPRQSARNVACIVAAVLVGVSCGSGSTDSSSTAPAPLASSAPPVDGEAPEILRFSNDLVGGGSFDASALAGKPAAFWFWAPT